jgi:hypothetical protein
MLTLAGLALLVAAGSKSDAEMLAQLWPGVHDSTEQVVVNTDRSIAGWTEGSEQRVRTIIAPVQLPWLGPHVLYLEEYLQDEPDQLRRQVLMLLEQHGPPEASVRVHLYTLRDPARWSHLDRRAKLAGQLQPGDIVRSSGCDLVLVREGDQFRGGTVGHDCSDPPGGGALYVDYQLMVGDGLYWYRRRLLRRQDDDLKEEVVGYNWFELNEARLFTCRIDWSASGRSIDLRPLLRLDLHDQGGRGRFTTPDGRKLELTLHSQDWAFARERDALILLVQPQGAETPLGSAWAEMDADQISLEIGWLRVRCGPLVPESDELSGALSAPTPRYPAATGG